MWFPSGTSICCSIESSVGCSGRTCFMLVFSVGWWGICAQVLGAAPSFPSHWPFCLQGCFTFFSLLSLTAAVDHFLNLSQLCCHSSNSIINRLSFGQWWVHFGARWNWLAQGLPLVSSHRDHLAIKTVPNKPHTAIQKDASVGLTIVSLSRFIC